LRLKKEMQKIKFKKLHPLAKEPYQKHSTDACFDVYATSKKRIGLFRIKYGIGLAFEISKGYRIDVKSRSSIYKTGLLLSNSIGTIDSPYRGEISALFYHILPWLRSYRIGDRIAQISLEKVLPIEFKESSKLSETNRGEGGFGSTGLK
jgi:dUTP pyrophosphatase